MIRNNIRFLGKFFAKPKTTGAILPSSRFLGRAMAKHCPKDSSIVLELGAGTGAVTKQILKLCKPDRLYSVELDEKLSAFLKKEFPKSKIISDSAENIKEFLEEEERPLGIIISSLPLLSIPEEIVKNILSAVEDNLPKGGKFVQFTYNLNRDPRELGFKKLKHISTQKIYMNVPPARVDVFRKEH